MTPEPEDLRDATITVAEDYVMGRDYHGSAQTLAHGLSPEALQYAAVWYLENVGPKRVRETTKGQEHAAKLARRSPKRIPRDPDQDQDYRRSLDEINERHDRKLFAGIGRILDEYRATLHAEWTADLLASTFALGDGRTVTWGEATIADHATRIDLLTKMAAGTLETAALHQKAIDELTATGLPSLAAMTEAA